MQRANPFAANSASANRFRGLIEGLSGLGVNITILITDGYQSLVEKKQFNNIGSNNGIKYNYLIRTNNSSIWQRRFNSYILNPFLSLILKKRFTKLLNSYGDAILWVGSELNQYKALPTKNKNVNHVYFAERSEFPDIYLYNNNTVNKLQKKHEEITLHYFNQYILPNLDGIALMTKTLINHYQQFPKPIPKLLHLPMTVDLERFNPNIQYPIFSDLVQPYIAFIGVMNNLKDGVDVLIEAFAKIATYFPNLTLYLFGFWHYDTPGQQKQIKSLNLQKRVFYRGTASRDEIPNIIMNAQLLVLPRPDTHQAQGGFPTKLGEYLATGRPVCATSVGEIPDYLTDDESVFFADPGSADSFANAMKKALSNPEKAKRIGANGRKVAEKHFNKDIQARLLYDFLKDLLSKDIHS